MYVCVYVCVLPIRTCLCTFLRVCMRPTAHMFDARVRVFVCMRSCMHALIKQKICVYVCVCARVRMRVCRRVCVRICVGKSRSKRKPFNREKKTCLGESQSGCQLECVYVYVRPPIRTCLCTFVRRPTAHMFDACAHTCACPCVYACVHACECAILALALAFARLAFARLCLRLLKASLRPYVCMHRPSVRPYVRPYVCTCVCA